MPDKPEDTAQRKGKIKAYKWLLDNCTVREIKWMISDERNRKQTNPNYQTFDDFIEICEHAIKTLQRKQTRERDYADTNFK